MSEKRVGIVGYGGYVPRLRLERSAAAAAHTWFDPAVRGLGKGQRAMANWDEDAITMAVAAARDCLTGSGITTTPGSILLASTTHPFEDRQNSVLVKEALNLDDTTVATDFAGSRRVGTTALLTALHSAHNIESPLLCIASEKMHAKPASEAEFFVGDGAAALAVGSDNIIAEFIGSHSVSVDFVDHFRQDGSEFDYTWESRWIRDEGYGKIAVAAIKKALEKNQLSTSDIDHFIIPTAMRGVNKYVAEKAGLDESTLHQDLHPVMGNAGSAQSMIALADCLQSAKPGACIMVVGFWARLRCTFI